MEKYCQSGMEHSAWHLLGIVLQPDSEGDRHVLRCGGVQGRGGASQMVGSSEETGG